MSECYPAACKLSDGMQYLIYCSGDQDFVVSQDGFHLAFKGVDALSDYVLRNKIGILHSDQCAEYDFEFLRRFSLKKECSVKNPKELMDCWNLLDDISESNRERWSLFVNKSNDLRVLHEKLLFDSNIFGDQSFKSQKWGDQEFHKLQYLFKIGYDLFIENMIIYK